LQHVSPYVAGEVDCNRCSQRSIRGSAFENIPCLKGASLRVSSTGKLSQSNWNSHRAAVERCVSVIGYRSRIWILDEIIRHAQSRPGVWFATHAEVARWAKEHAA
jgi:hypothetical protein